MENNIMKYIKKLLLKCLSIMSSRALRTIGLMIEYEKFKKLNGYSKKLALLPPRSNIWDFIMEDIIGENPINYLEFGVYGGESILYWAKKNKHKNSIFVGFDTFTGLPGDWKSFQKISKKYGKTIPKGHFSTKGSVPGTKDNRVSFVKGVFNETLLPYLDNFINYADLTNTLIVHMDADIYESTLYPLVSLSKLLKPGSIIIFDEPSVVFDEFRALNDYIRAFGIKYKLISYTLDCDKIAILIK